MRARDLNREKVWVAAFDPNATVGIAPPKRSAMRYPVLPQRQLVL